MSIPERDRLRQIKTFPSLVKYLRDELSWPIESSNFDDITFDYAPEELGLDSQTAVKIEEIKQLRPLVTNQPWGIFFIKFAPKQLPVVALRRILGQLVFKNRASSRKSDRASWNLHDLLFISNYGEGEERQITFAHFTQRENKSDLPALKVLGWDDEDTALHLDDVHEKLKLKLFWPADESDLSSWRKNWAEAFVLRPREVITTSQELAIRLADLARRIRRRASRVMKVESERGPLRKLHKAFREALIHDLGENDFADMYAQTITYGLFSSAVFRPAGVAADTTAQMIPMANSFLKEMLHTFLTVGGRKDKFDFDELGIQEVVELLNSPDTHMEAVLRDFDNRNPQEDPVIHFYEHFLAEYDKQMKVSRGVFYTPKPVVSYIVRSVHELLQSEFGLEDGLASTVTWAEMAEKNRSIKIPEGTNPAEAFVQILDPATGTGTFLVEAIDVIHSTMAAKWSKLGNEQPEIDKLWDEYVPKHLLLRLHGYELIMAPYAIAHIKIGLKLLETGYRFKANDTLNIYLTNSLEPPSQLADTEVAGFFEPLAKESKIVNTVKRNKRFTVVIGNPPYSGHSANDSKNPDGTLNFIGALLQDYYKVDGAPLGERNPKWLQDDYVKFIRYGQWHIEQSKEGILSMITNHGYLDNPTFRGMRQQLTKTYDMIYILDLHGNAKKKETCLDGSKDENVFDIQQGVSISLMIKNCDQKNTQAVFHADLYGTRERKYDELIKRGTKWSSISPQEPFYLFIYQDTNLKSEYDLGWKITDIFPINSVGIVTGKDAVAIAVNREEAIFLANRHKVPQSCIRPVMYRVFDERYLIYDSKLVTRMRLEVMRHMMSKKNIAIVCTRQQSTQNAYSLVGVTNKIIESCYISNRTAEINYMYPLYIYPNNDENQLSLFKIVKGSGLDGREPNLSARFTSEIKIRLGLEFVTDGRGDLKKNFGPEDVLSYIYGIFYSTRYRKRYSEFLKIDFPRLPFTRNVELFRAMVHFGDELVCLHLMESPKLDKHIAKFVGGKTPEIEKVYWSDETVWIDKAQTNGFKGVPENVWNFYIGGYQVCEKWLKDRKGRKFSKSDIEHYQKIVVALNETIKIMADIDKVIDAYGGWPGAFQK